jgi:hypothetical protein
MVEEPVVAAVMAAVSDIPEEHVRQVITALYAVKEGAPVGTLARDPASGNIACRVTEGGVPVWKVTALDGGTWTDLQPTLAGWEVIGGNAEPAPPKTRTTKKTTPKPDESKEG